MTSKASPAPWRHSSGAPRASTAAARRVQAPMSRARTAAAGRTALPAAVSPRIIAELGRQDRRAERLAASML